MSSPPTIEALTAGVEAELRDVLNSRDMPLYRMMTYHLGWDDDREQPQSSSTRERSHGVACLTACYAAGGDLQEALPAAASVEMVSNFCQIHDDVQGGQPQRHGRDAVWWVWGPAQAINAGDGMHALARLSIFRLQERGVSSETTFRAVQLLDQASLEVCEGRFQDLEAQERIDLSVDGYLKMASSKTGALYSCAMKLGAMVASAEEAVVEAVGECGAKVGMAVQVRDDLRELWPNGEGGDTPGTEVLNKKKLFPVVYAVEKANISVKRRLGEVYFKRVLGPDDVASIRHILDELGAREYSQELVERYRTEAHATLTVPGISSDGAAAVKGFVDWSLGL